VGLAQAEVERRGIATVSLTLMPEITRKIRVPRALGVPFPLGYPLGNPGDAEGQREVLLAALELLARDDVPVLEEYRSS
jgi:hypothetical protein